MDFETEEMIYQARLCKYNNAEMPQEITTRWPGAIICPGGSTGLALMLPDDTVVKITTYELELDIARRVMEEKPRGVVPVIEVGAYYYRMPRCAEYKGREWPDTDCSHADAAVYYTGYRAHNIMFHEGKPVYIDLDGLWIPEQREQKAG